MKIQSVRSILLACLLVMASAVPVLAADGAPSKCYRPGLRVSSSPSGATVVINGCEVGVTPLSYVPCNPSQDVLVQLRKPGYAEWSSLYAVWPGQVRDVTADLQPSEGIVRVESTVSVYVQVDGGMQPVGVTPLEITHLAPGAHRVYVSAPGMLPQCAQVSVEPGRAVRVRFQPEPLQARKTPTPATPCEPVVTLEP